MRRPIGVDLFAGAGGMSLGFEQAGFDIAAAVEIDPVHAAVHKFNFPGCATLPRSVIDIDGSTIRHTANIDHVDVVFGGAPCQGFSMIGQRSIEDPRNALVSHFIRLVSELDATYFVFENVRGLTLGRHRRFLDELIALCDTHGYDVRLPWRVLNAADYGVPQDRQRLFLLGARKGAALPSYPAPMTRLPADGQSRRPVCPCCRDALGDLPEADDFAPLLMSDEVETAQWGEPSEFARGLRCDGNGSWGFGYKRHWNPMLLTSSLRTTHTELSRRRFDATPPGAVEPVSRFYRLPECGVSNTLRAGTDAARGAFTSPRPIHYAKARCVTVREMARLHGFPDWFRLHETKWHGARQVGNAVPAPLARAVAASIITAMNVTVVPPYAAMALGSTDLLRMDMTSAARYWSVPNPIAKRDRKSGRTKRRQEMTDADLGPGSQGRESPVRLGRRARAHGEVTLTLALEYE